MLQRGDICLKLFLILWIVHYIVFRSVSSKRCQIEVIYLKWGIDIFCRNNDLSYLDTLIFNLMTGY